MKGGQSNSSSDPAGGYPDDSKEKWIAIDRLCDAYEAALQEGPVERAPFLAGVPTQWRKQLCIEFDAIDTAYRDSEETREDTLPSSGASEIPSILPGDGRLANLRTLESKKVWLGRFEIRQRLGSGATGSVWCARDARLARWVALKVPHATRVMSETTAGRFQTEARAAAAIMHPNVVQVHEVLMEDGLPILVQQWIDGPSLASYLKDHGHLDFAMAADWMIQIADAVSCAHENGVVHRDLKPANVMICQDRPMVLDFGLASYPEFSSGLTTEGTVLGTPAYMSPEQAEGSESAVEPTTDIYALGAILYEMLVGTPPFVGKTKEVLHAAKTTMPTSPRSRRAGVPRDLETIVLRCLCKSPADRYQSAAELRDDLKRYRNHEPIKARQISPLEYVWAWCKVRPVKSLVAVSALVIGWLAVAMFFSVVEQMRLSDHAKALQADQVRNLRLYDKLIDQRNSIQLARASQELADGNWLRGQSMLDNIDDELRGWEWRLLNNTSSSPCVILNDGSMSSRQTDAAITSLAVAEKSNQLFASTDNGTIFTWKSKKAAGDKSTAALDDRYGEPSVLHQVGNQINAIAVSPNNAMLGWVEDGGKIGIWDLNQNELIDYLDSPRGQVGFAISFSNNSRRVVIGGGESASSEIEGTRRSWLALYRCSVKEGIELQHERPWNDLEPVTSIRFIASNEMVITRGGQHAHLASYVERWKVLRRRLERGATIANGIGLRGLDYHEDTHCLSWCDGLGVISVYNVLEQATVCRHRVSEKPLTASQFSRDGSEVIVVGEDLVMTRWRIATELASVDSVDEKTNSLSATSSGTEVDSEGASGPKVENDPGNPVSKTRPVNRISDIAPCTFVRDYRGHSQRVNHMAFVPDQKLSGPQLVSCSDDGTIRLWSEEEDPSIERLELRRSRVVSASWLSQDRIVVLTKAKPSRKLVLHRQNGFNRYGIKVEHVHARNVKSVAPVSRSGQMVVFDQRTPSKGLGQPEPVKTFKTLESPFLVRTDSAVHLFGIDDLPPEFSCSIEPSDVAKITSAVAFDARWMIYTSADETDPMAPLPHSIETRLHLFDVSLDHHVKSATLGVAGQVSQLDISSRHGVLAGGSDSGGAFWMPLIVDCPTGRSMIDLPAIRWQTEHRKINALKWLGDQPRLATVGDDGMCTIWDFGHILSDEQTSVDLCSVPANAKPIRQYRLHACSGPVNVIHSSPSGDRIVTVGVDRVIRVWDSQSGLELVSLSRRNADVKSVEFSPDERFLLIAEDGGRLEVIKL